MARVGNGPHCVTRASERRRGARSLQWLAQTAVSAQPSHRSNHCRIMTINTSRYLLASPGTSDSSDLSRHLLQCRAAQGRLFAASVWAERAHSLVAPRFVTTIAAVASLMVVGSWWF